MMTIRNYVRAQSLEEAYTLNQSRQNRILGGMMWLKMTKNPINTAIDLSLLGLDTIEETADGFSIGAMVTLRQLELHEGLAAYTCGAMNAAVRDIVGVQFRNMATVGGSLFARMGFSDLVTVFLALDADVELYKGGIVPMERFVTMEKDNDILVRVLVKKQNARFAYQVMRSSRADLPVLNCAAAKIDGSYRLAVGARPAGAVLLRDTQGMTAETFADYAAQNIPTGSNSRGSAAYRTHLIRVLAQRALTELEGTNHGN